jgi:hypothetical protein
MADRYYGVTLGGQLPVHVTEAATTTGAPIELRINDSVYSQPLLAQLAAEAILRYLRTKETNPVA